MCVYVLILYCLPIHARIYTCIQIHTHMHSSRLFTPTTTTTTGDEEEAPSGRSRLYARPLCAVWPRMGNEGIGGMRSLDTSRTWPSKIWRRGIIQRAQKELESCAMYLHYSAVLAESC